MKEQIEVRIKELDSLIKELSLERKELEQQRAEMQTDLRVGDRVTYEGANCVWELTRIIAGYFNKPDFYGRKIKKDGTPGVVVKSIVGNYNKPLFKVK